MVSNVWCGFDVPESKKEALTEMTLCQFKLPVRERLSTEKLLKLIGVNIKIKE